jgi:hypothetical protein
MPSWLAYGQICLYCTLFVQTIKRSVVRYRNEEVKCHISFNVILIAVRKMSVASKVDCGCPVKFVQELLNRMYLSEIIRKSYLQFLC